MTQKSLEKNDSYDSNKKEKHLPEQSKNVEKSEKFRLDLSHRELKEFPNDFYIAEEINYLDISFNNFEQFPVKLYLSNLNGLNCSHNRFINFPQIEDSLDHLTNLNLSHNKLKSIPSLLYTNLPNLRILDLSYNKIEECKIPLKCYKYLEKFYLNNNNLIEFPIWILDVMCKNLIELELNSNPSMVGVSVHIPSLILNKSVKLINLDDCALSFNSIQFIESFLYLESMSISNTQKHHSNTTLWEFKPLNLQWKIHLRILKLSNVFLSNVPICLKYLENLEYLDLSNNNLYWLNTHLTCTKLTYCDLSNNSLFNLPENIGELNSLKHLDLSSNKIVELPESFHKLINLTYLDLYDNQIEENPITLESFPNLDSLDLHINYFSIPKENKKYLTLSNKLRETKKDRSSGTKILPEVPSDHDDLKSIDNYSDRDFTENETNVPEIEYWDDDCDSEFDPTENGFKTFLQKSDTKENYINHLNMFCPADIHPKPIFSKKVKHDVVEGQFDDE